MGTYKTLDYGEKLTRRSILEILLRYNLIPIATLEVSSKYIPNKAKEAKACYGTTSIEHPAVSMITTERGKYYCGGKITGLNVPIREFPW